MKDFFVPKDLLLFTNNMGMNLDFSVRGFNAGVSEAMATLTVTVSSSAAVPWTPDMISGAVWIDADTVTLSGSAVTAMTDKVGGTIQASQGTAANQPTIVTNVLNGEPVIQFDGGDFLSFGTALGRPANYTIFVIGMFADVGTATTAHLCGQGEPTGSAAKMWGRCSVYNSQAWFGFGNDVSSSYGYVSSAFSAGAWFLYTSRYTAGDNAESIRINGTTKTVVKSATSATQNSGNAYNYDLGRLGGFGKYAANGSRLKGFVCVPSAISDADVARLEGYYAHLCGLASLLPSNHPYKSTPPTI